MNFQSITQLRRSLLGVSARGFNGAGTGAGATAAAVCCLALVTACNSGSGKNSGGTADSGPDNTLLGQDTTVDNSEVGVVAPLAPPAEPAPEDLTSLDRVSLVVNADSLCAVVGEPLNLSVTRAPTEAEAASGSTEPDVNVTSYVSYTQGLGDSLALLSVTDDEASFSLSRQDVLSLSVDLDNGSVTAYLAGFAAESPASAVLQKPVPGGCLYAFRTQGYCATGLSKSGPVTFTYEGQGISATGCELDNPEGYAVFELPPYPSAQ